MSFTFEETPESRAQSSGTSSNASHTRTYIANGEQDDYTVHAYAIANTSPYVSQPTGYLWRNQINVRPAGFKQYIVEVSYARLDRNTLPVGSNTFSFDTTGGTVHITDAKEHVGTYNSSGTVANDAHGGSIGVKEDGSKDGCDIIIPKLRITFPFKYPIGIVTSTFLKNLASITGTTNIRRFLGFEAGELLFLGATGSNGTEVEMEVTFQFEASSNAINLTVGKGSYKVTVPSKYGHDYLWTNTKDVVVSGKPRTVVDEVHIEQVYDSADWDATFQWNKYTAG